MTAKSYSKKKQVDHCDLEKQLEKYAVASLIFGLNHILTHILCNRNVLESLVFNKQMKPTN